MLETHHSNRGASSMDKDYLVVYCTCPDRQVAERIANTIVAESLAACVNILPGITSVYRWQGQVQQDPEILLIIKTDGDTYPALETRIRALHPYEVPEIIALSIRRGMAEYLDWMTSSIAKPT